MRMMRPRCPGCGRRMIFRTRWLQLWNAAGRLLGISGRESWECRNPRCRFYMKGKR